MGTDAGVARALPLLNLMAGTPSVSSARSKTVFTVLVAVSIGHLLNDLIQSLLPAVYPLLKAEFGLDFVHIGLITLANQLTASLLQPAVGHFTDRSPKPYSLAIGMTSTLLGVLLLAAAPSYLLLVPAAALIGIGSAVFHPESSRVARMASGGQHGLAQSLFQTGGNAGSSLGPLLAAFIVAPYGRQNIAWFALVAMLAIALLWRVGRWYAHAGIKRAAAAHHDLPHGLPDSDVRRGVAILLVLVFSKYVYLASLTSFFTFFLIHKFDISVQSAQLHLFGFLAGVAAGTFAGGPIGDRVGRKVVIWVSILGVLPFTLVLPYANLFWTSVLSVVIGLVLASAFSAILVYGQELLPGRVGLVSGLFFGFAFGIAGVAAAALGWLADVTSIETVYRLCAFLPALGILTAWLPDRRPAHGP
ncbi:MAG TPA: MFS transporter [Vicinamibacterales bacterium]|nr:MFS transporter [Vicinamibacterales bacterium]